MKWRKTNWLEWRSYVQGSISLRFPHQNGVEDGVDLEGRKRGDAMKLGLGGESRKKEREEEKERAG